MADDPRRFVADAENDMAILIGDPAEQKFIGMGLLDSLLGQGYTRDQVAVWLAPGETVMSDAQLKAKRFSPKA